MNPLRASRLLYEEWRRNYRHRSGLSGLARGLAGSLRVSWGPPSPPRPVADLGCDIEIVTFSVLPGLTRMWARTLVPVLAPALMGRRAGVIVGDCSGGLEAEGLPRDFAHVRILPIFNHDHGIKLDLFMNRVCRAPFVLVCDDDIFWLGARPLTWALAQLEARPGLAAVSLYPRLAPKPVLAGKVEQPMGSFCLVLRRDVWIEEQLSFRCYDTQGSGSYDWTYDTADLAHVELLRRGYEVAIATPEQRVDLATLEGVSTWGLKLQKHRGDMSRLLQTRLRLCKAYRVFCFLARAPETIVDPDLLTRGLDWCQNQLSATDLLQIDTEVAELIERLQ